MPSLKRIAKFLLPRSVATWCVDMRLARAVDQLPDRRLLVGPIFEALGKANAFARDKTVLWVGCRAYTSQYYRYFEANGARCFTIDSDPVARKWGNGEAHIVEDLLRLDRVFAPQSLDAVLCNGVFGWGIDTLQAQSAAARSMALTMKPGAWLLLGWNSDRMADPILGEVFSPLFDPVPLGQLQQRTIVSGSTHTYDFLQRNSVNVTEQIELGDRE